MCVCLCKGSSCAVIEWRVSARAAHVHSRVACVLSHARAAHVTCVLQPRGTLVELAKAGGLVGLMARQNNQLRSIVGQEQSLKKLQMVLGRVP